MLLAYIVYETDKERNILKDWCKRYKVFWCDGELVEESFVDILYASPSNPCTLNIHTGPYHGNIKRSDDLMFMRRHFTEKEFYLYDNNRISSYIKENVMTEEKFKQFIELSKEVTL